MRPINDEQFLRLCSAEMSDPVPLACADICSPFVYDRAFGLFYVPSGYHQGAMSLLLAFHHQLLSGAAVAEKLRLTFSSGTADHWPEHVPGTCFLSSVGEGSIKAGRRGNLNAMELRLLGPVDYLFGSSRNEN